MRIFGRHLRRAMARSSLPVSAIGLLRCQRRRLPFQHDVSMSALPAILGPEQAVRDGRDFVVVPAKSSQAPEVVPSAGEQCPESRRVVSLCKEIAGDTVFERLGVAAVAISSPRSKMYCC